MMFIDWNIFTSEFALAPCPENKAIMALTQLEPNQYFQGRCNVEVDTNKFRDLVDMSGYTDPIAIILKFYRDLDATIQDRIAKSGTDRPCNNDFDGWFKAPHQLDLNCLANKAFYYAL
jgi:hypothetical protein